jgi:hypothetical protein
VAQADCAAATSSFRTLAHPELYRQTDLSDAAAQLHAILPSTYGEDLDTILLDAISRVSDPGQPPNDPAQPPANVAAALQRVGSVVLADCPG